MRLLAFFNTKKRVAARSRPARRSSADPSGEINNLKDYSDKSGLLNIFFNNDTAHLKIIRFEINE
jgi:hypothetical protein